MSPFSGLLKSRKFWLSILNVALSTAIFFVAKYVNPEAAEDVLWLIGSWQPIFVAVIVGIVSEDNNVRNNAVK